jgi:hypothetical protein
MDKNTQMLLIGAVIVIVVIVAYIYMQDPYMQDPYTFIPFLDSNGNDIGRKNGDINALKNMCIKNTQCKGFNSNGWLKNTLLPKANWIKWTDDVTKGFYVKN